MLSKKTSMVTMVTDEFLENRIILHKSVATIGFIWFFWFQKCILLYIFAQVFLVMRSIRSHISRFRLGFTPTLSTKVYIASRVLCMGNVFKNLSSGLYSDEEWKMLLQQGSWTEVHRRSTDLCKTVLCLIDMVLTILASTAVCEHGFRAMKEIKSH